jgi:serine protease AprX
MTNKDLQTYIPEEIFAEISPNSNGRESLFDPKESITTENVEQFFSKKEVVHNTIKRLEELGFRVLNTNYITISISGLRPLYEKVFETSLTIVERPAVKHLGQMAVAHIISPEENDSGYLDVSKSSLADLAEGGAFERKCHLDQISYLPPSKFYWKLDVPNEISSAMDADRVHRTGVTGRGIRVIMVDTGWYRHPFFTQRGYHINNTVLGPLAKDPNHDEVGHGTGESANVFAIAPDIDFTMIKFSQNRSAANADFNTAVQLRPDVISCSWSYDLRETDRSQSSHFPADLQPLAASVANAVRQGIIVVFSAGNGKFGFPGMHPDVISAGGTYMDQNGKLEATEYTSGYSSIIYQGRNVPDVSGLVGKPPKAAYIMLPVEPNDEIDRNLAGGRHPDGDETTKDDGWAAFSGTSAAAPQLAGICALIKQVCPQLSPRQVRDILMRTATDVTAGRCSPNTGGHPAQEGSDIATGAGLANAFKAVMEAKKSCP